MKKLCVLRRILCSFLAAAMMLSAAGCNLLEKSDNKSNSINTAKPITNYFKSTDYTYPDEISDISNMQCMNDKLYMSGYTSAENADHLATVYDTATGEKVDVDTSKIGDISYFHYVFLTQDVIYIEYTDTSDNYIAHICALSRSTGEKLADVELGSDTYTTGLYANNNGDICTIATSYTSSSQESMMIIYDKNTLEEKERININEKISIPDNKMIIFVLPMQDGSYYAFSMDTTGNSDGDKIDIYRISSSFEIIYEVEDAFSDMTGNFNGAFIAKNGNLCIMTFDYESESGIFNTNELDANTGDVVERYEPELGNNVNVLPFVTSDGYDFLYIKDGKLYGYDIKNEKETQIVDCANQVGEEYNECYTMSVCGSSILLATDYYGDGSSQSLFEMDADGNILNKIPLPENAQPYNMKISKDGLISVICCDYSDGSESYEICTIDNQGNEKSRISLSPEAGDGKEIYLNNFLINGSDEVCAAYEIYDRSGGDGGSQNVIAVFDKDGNEKFKIEDKSIGYVQQMISTENGDYAYYYKDNSGSQLSKIDYDNKCMGESVDIDINFNDVYPGDDKYDFYYNDGEGIYGFNIKDKKSTEIINWIDSDIDFENGNACVVSADKILLNSYDRQTGQPSMCQLDRVDEETLKLIQNKKIITVAGVGITYGEVKDAIVKFNKENDKYRIQVNDYNKYSSYDDDNYISGASHLNTDMAAGNLPDIIMGNYEVDMSTYTSKGLLADLNPFIEKDKDISREDYFENIFDMYSTDGKLYQLVTDFNVTTLAGKESDLGDKSGWSFDEFFSFVDGKKAFYLKSREELLTCITDNLSEYVDFNKKTCDFNNDNFIKLLEFIKENGLTDEEMEEQSYYGKDDYDEERYNEYVARFQNNKCYLEIENICSFNQIADFQQNVIKDTVCFKGVPSSSEGNGALICADSTIGIADKSSVKDGAWDFVRGFMLEDYQKGMNDEYAHTFPVMKSAFDDLATQSQSNDNSASMKYSSADENLKPLDTKSIDKFRDLVQNASRAAVSDSKINKIINEQVDEFFEGGQSAKEAAEAIQSKASLYLKEIK